jgi:response regulator RpfG family c-di-GMP phosphodiesterase
MDKIGRSLQERSACDTATSCREVSVMSADGIIFVVDDEMRVLVALENLLTAVGYHVRPYDSGELFLSTPKPEVPCSSFSI